MQVEDDGAESNVISDVVVLGFVSSEHTDAPRNPKLCDFARESSVYPGEKRMVKLCVDALGVALALVNEKGEQRVLPGEYVMTAGVAGGVGGAGAGSVIGTIVVVSEAVP